MNNDTHDIQPAHRFGTFLGVFTPSVLTILGLIMYLRFGWVVGNVGLAYTVAIVLLASSITTITALSASAVATNMRVGVGGEYYLISHSLGLELGGAIGIPLFLCRTLSITFYSFGLAESLVSLWPADREPLPTYAIPVLTVAVIVVITAVAGKSATLALRLQIPILIVVGLSVVALAVGVLTGPLEAPTFEATYSTAPKGFWYVFAVFFPAVTGFTAGIGMSGDLADPRKSIPRGTLLAVAVGTGTYLLIPVLLAISAQVTPEFLMDVESSVWNKVAIFGPWLVYPGLIGAILSSAVGSALGGPRVLQALAKDGLAPRFLAKTSKTGQPMVATWVSGVIAVSAVALGGLNAVAQFVTILFLTLYLMINLSAGLEQLVGDPSYRPTIRVPWALSLLGSLGAILVMFLINPWAGVLGIGLELLLFLQLRRQSLQKRWGDVRAGLWVAVARFALLKLRLHRSDPRNWRPHILAFIGDPVRRLGLVRLASWFQQGRGVVTACQLVEGDLERESVEIAGLRQAMDRTFDEEGLIIFSEVNVVNEFERGVIDVTQANGFAGLHSNTVMFGWSGKRERLVSQLRILRAVARVGKSMIIARVRWAYEPGRPKRIDLWWGGLQNNGDMMLLFAYMLRLNSEWQDAQLVVRSIVNSEEERQSMSESLHKLIPEARIKAEAQIILRAPGEAVKDIIHRESHSAEVVFLGLSEPAPGGEEEYAERLEELTAGLNTTILVRNAGEFAGNLI